MGNQQSEHQRLEQRLDKIKTCIEKLQSSIQSLEEDLEFFESTLTEKQCAPTDITDYEIKEAENQFQIGRRNSIETIMINKEKESIERLILMLSDQLNLMNRVGKKIQARLTTSVSVST
jgi:chromosome segregation ATPase